MTRRPLLLLLLTPALASLLLACNGEKTPAPRAAAPVGPSLVTGPEAPWSSGPITTADPTEYLARGEHFYRSSCASCHDTGAGDTPKTGDIATWKPRIALGLDTLVHHAIEGYGSSACVMPPRGGHPDLHIEAVALAVRYMIEMSLPEEERRLPSAQ